MWSAVFCFSFISAASAAPLSNFYSFLPHYGNQMANQQYNRILTEQLLPPRGQGAGAIIHPGFQGTAAGGQGSGTAFIKYSLPKAPGGKSIEIYYPYNYRQGEVLPNVMPQIPNIFPFGYPTQTGPQQQPPRQAAPPQANDPLANDPQQQQIQHDPQVPAGQLDGFYQPEAAAPLNSDEAEEAEEAEAAEGAAETEVANGSEGAEPTAEEPIPDPTTADPAALPVDAPADPEVVLDYPLATDVSNIEVNVADLNDPVTATASPPPYFP
ncbi:secretory calcium-binding phosphoprotein 5 precursor [Silurus asotus]|uniref:Secretory calcium-binding phosphoprotein 5 n=1 Tax=Silurus asotus TaxID=30991 RepID=A0AAD5AQE1_SILAS|nr:secretory calcium-binding phosphoprotein 5 precursor [Silurus asotus]